MFEIFKANAKIKELERRNKNQQDMINSYQAALDELKRVAEFYAKNQKKDIEKYEVENAKLKLRIEELEHQLITAKTYILELEKN